MTTLEAIILGIIQGLTEFFPVSSSGHLSLAQHLLGLTNLEDFIFFDLVCHLGTLFAILIVLASPLKSIWTHNRERLVQTVIGTLPLFPLVFFLKPLEEMFNKPHYLGCCFLFTALLLYMGIKWNRESSPQKLEKRKWSDALIIGVFQAVAILPGVSRSGSTLSGASLLGWSRQDAITFSFLLAIPAILGATALQLLKLFLGTDVASLPVETACYFAGFLTSFVVGFLTLRALIKLAMKGRLMYFVWYCLILGIGVTLFL